ncbi:MAG: M15 family metallopeptidase [Acidimicrobiales bacterium]
MTSVRRASAVDINSAQNPDVRGSTVLPPGGRDRLDRGPAARIIADAGVVQAVAGIGWRWGGSWTAFRDGQHFSATGR